MQMIDNQPLDQVAERGNEFRSPSDTDNGMDDLIVLSFLILYLFLLRNQFFNDIREILGQRLPHLGTGILGSHSLGHLHQPVKGNLKPVLQIFLIILLLHHQLQLLHGLIDQRGQAPLVPAA